MYNFPFISLVAGQIEQAHPTGCALFRARYVSPSLGTFAPELAIIETPFGEVLGMAQRVLTDDAGPDYGTVLVGPAVAHPEWITVAQASRIARQLWDDSVDYVWLTRSTVIEQEGGNGVRADILPIHHFDKVLRTEEWHERYPLGESAIESAFISQYVGNAFRYAGIGSYTCGIGVTPS